MRRCLWFPTTTLVFQHGVLFVPSNIIRSWLLPNDSAVDVFILVGFNCISCANFSRSALSAFKMARVACSASLNALTSFNTGRRINIAPKVIVIAAVSFPGSVTGTISPYPTVVHDIKLNQKPEKIPSCRNCESGLEMSAK